MPKIRIRDEKGDVKLEFRPGNTVRIAGHPIPKSHPWIKAASVGVLAHPVLEAKGYTSELVSDPVKTPFSPQREDVTTERDRRINQQVTVTLDGGRNFPVDMDYGSRANITNIATVASENESLGITVPITFRDANNRNQVLTNKQFRALALQVASQVNAIYTASWVLKDLNTIPTDFTDDKHWP